MHLGGWKVRNKQDIPTNRNYKIQGFIYAQDDKIVPNNQLINPNLFSFAGHPDSESIVDLRMEDEKNVTSHVSHETTITLKFLK